MLGDYPRDACTPADLLAFRSAWGPALGTSYSRLVLVNGSSFDCTLPEPVTVELRDRDGTLLLAREASADAIGARAMPAGGTAMAMLAFANWCDARPATPLALDVALPSGRLRVAPAPLAVDVIPVPPCMSEGSPPPPAFEVEPLAAPPAPAAAAVRRR